MTEMPFDVLNARLGKIRDNGNIDFDNTAAAVDIDEELQRKFLFFPISELEALEEQIEESRDGLYLGSGVPYATCPVDAAPEDLFTRAENALVIYWHLKKKAELAEKLERKRREKLALRPKPGVYHTTGSGSLAFTAIVTEDKRVVIPMDDGELLDQSHLYDAQGWNMRPINLTDGTVCG